jgi:hypothetical protein
MLYSAQAPRRQPPQGRTRAQANAANRPMIPSVTSIVSTAHGSTSSGAADLALLKSQAAKLKERLAQTRQSGASQASAVESGTISLQIVNVQSQIEQLILEAQLAKLSAGKGDTAQAAPDEPAPARAAVDNPGSAAATASHAGWRHAMARTTGGVLDLQA